MTETGKGIVHRDSGWGDRLVFLLSLAAQKTSWGEPETGQIDAMSLHFRSNPGKSISMVVEYLRPAKD